MSEAPDLIHVNGAPGNAVDALDRGLHYGDGVFETIACVQGRPRLLALHLARLARGCERLRIPAPGPEEVAAELHTLAAARPRSILKLILTRGVAQARGYAYTGAEVPGRIVLRYPWPEAPAPAPLRVRIADLVLAENPLTAGIKHLNRLEQVLARAEWSDPAIAEALLFTRGGSLISGTMSNVFLVRHGCLLTPALTRCGVAGIMRALVLQRAHGLGLSVSEGELTRADLDAAEEVFLTNALTGIRRVGQIGGRRLTADRVTLALQASIAPALAGEA